jgi:hypothetical protein
LVEKLRGDKDISDFIYGVDYDVHWYDERVHLSFYRNEFTKEFEKKADKSLSYFSYICYLFLEKEITAKEFEVFDFELVRLAQNFEVQSYLHNLYCYAYLKKIPLPFKYLFIYFKNNELLPDEVFKMNTKKYSKYLEYWNFDEDKVNIKWIYGSKMKNDNREIKHFSIESKEGRINNVCNKK